VVILYWIRMGCNCNIDRDVEEGKTRLIIFEKLSKYIRRKIWSLNFRKSLEDWGTLEETRLSICNFHCSAFYLWIHTGLSLWSWNQNDIGEIYLSLKIRMKGSQSLCRQLYSLKIYKLVILFTQLLSCWFFKRKLCQSAKENRRFLKITFKIKLLYWMLMAIWATIGIKLIRSKAVFAQYSW
jgi:hypothetical protein